ncbi:Na+/melibiose symporter [Altererythrobacter xiamenensis]|uniref:Na+/melibiose symporter n=1 Tax=Altererythrobacter xiamenensis TaxID=1316679 RepID=A0A1Y6FN81_9SPHN|nr:MFS transporter [Altererythrobacter xiamenensis]SMQ74312.1 Na+/melibiose symporter [Altererythrobacter xiamenensis]
MDVAQSGAIAPERDKPSIGLKVAHGIGAAAFGIKNNGFDYFLLFFYGTVIGLEPGLVGLAILIALVFDAISDPLVGYWSDNFRSRWGRRHPFMYAAALPVALSYFLLWNPPDLGQSGLFAYLTLMAILIRTFITFYETPSSSLIPELSRDYAERTSIQSYRIFFGWAGGNIMSVVMFGLLLTGPLGMRDRDAYETYGMIGSAAIFIAIMISAVGTHHRIPHLHSPTVMGERFGMRRIFREMVEILSERSFIALFLATVLFSIATGLSAALAFLMLNYFWQFSEEQIFIWTATVFFSALFGFLLAPYATRKLGKKRATIVIGLLAFGIQPMPVLLRLVGIMPENGDPLLFPLVLGINIIDLSLIIAMQAVSFSMIADLVESNQLKTGRRNEGVYYAAITFTRKTTQGLGVLAAGLILSVIAFPEGADPATVSPDTLWALGAWYAPSLLALWMGSLFFVSRYKISREDHEDNLRRLAEAPTS